MEKPTSIKIVKYMLIIKLIAYIILTLLLTCGVFKLDAYTYGQNFGVDILLLILSLVFLKLLKFKPLAIVLVLQVVACFSCKNIPGFIYTLIPAIIVDFVPDVKRYFKNEVKS
jgi:hypothetical protein